jgi:hypothetical protein
MSPFSEKAVIKKAFLIYFILYYYYYHYILIMPFFHPSAWASKTRVIFNLTLLNSSFIYTLHLNEVNITLKTNQS